MATKLDKKVRCFARVVQEKLDDGNDRSHDDILEALDDLDRNVASLKKVLMNRGNSEDVASESADIALDLIDLIGKVKDLEEDEDEDEDC